MGRLTRRDVMLGSMAGWQIALAGTPVRLPVRVRVAILGLEGHSGEILEPLPFLPDVELVAICSSAAQELPSMPQNVKAKRYWNARQMLDQERADVVAVCNNNGERAAAILDCLGHGAHVIAEKPLALRRADLQAIRTAAERSGKQVGMLLPMRFEPMYLQMKQAVADGLVGDVVTIDAQKSYKAGVREEWYRHRDTYGGTIPWVGIHMIDLMRFVSGREFREVSAFAANVAAPALGEMENVAVAAFRLDNGGAASLRLDYCRPETAPTHGDDRLRVAGTKGVVEFQEKTGTVLLTQTSRQLPPLPPAQSVFVDFLESVYNGKPSRLPAGDIYRVNEVALGAQEAVEQRRIVAL